MGIFKEVLITGKARNKREKKEISNKYILNLLQKISNKYFKNKNVTLLKVKCYGNYSNTYDYFLLVDYDFTNNTEEKRFFLGNGRILQHVKLLLKSAAAMGKGYGEREESYFNQPSQ